MAIKNQDGTMISGFCNDAKGQLVIKRESQAGNKTVDLRSAQNPLAPIYHVVFHFDQHSQNVECIGINNYCNSLYGLQWISTNTLEGYIEGVYYTLLCLFYLPSGDQTIPGWIIQENFNVYRDVDTAISSTMIHHTIALPIHNENDSLIKNT